MIVSEIAVDLRLIEKNGSKLRAYADVTITLGQHGVIKISGFPVFVADDGKISVGIIRNKGQKKSFDVVVPMGQIRTLIEAAVTAEYERRAGKPSGAES
jgi:hypothetical protein